MSRVTYLSIFIIWFSSALVFILFDKPDKTISHSEFLFYFFVTLLIFLLIFSRYVNKNLERIGELQLTRGEIRKSIAGIKSSYKLKDLDQIVVKKHIRSFLFSLNKDGTKTYLITIIGKNQINEVFIVSSQSIGKPSFNFHDILMKIQKITNEPVSIVKS